MLTLCQRIALSQNVVQDAERLADKTPSELRKCFHAVCLAGVHLI